MQMSEGTENQSENLAITTEIEDVVAKLIDIEEYVLAGKPIPKAHKYRYRVNKIKYESEAEEITREQILEKAGKVPVTQYRLSEKRRGQPPTEIQPGTTIHLRKHEIERFIAQEIEVQDGLGNDRREFTLSAEDSAFLDGIGVKWEAIKRDQRLWVILYDVPVPSGYTANAVDVAFEIAAGYPTSQIDMGYFHPPLMLSSRRTIARTEGIQKLDGKDWQQWSRHRIGGAAWKPGVDNLETHFTYMQEWLAREMAR